MSGVSAVPDLTDRDLHVRAFHVHASTNSALCARSIFTDRTLLRIVRHSALSSPSFVCVCACVCVCVCVCVGGWVGVWVSVCVKRKTYFAAQIHTHNYTRLQDKRAQLRFRVSKSSSVGSSNKTEHVRRQ